MESVRGAGRRDPALDGLRGVAAVVVLIHHSLLALPSMVDPYTSLAAVAGTAGWIAYTPLHLVYAGGEAVLVFFVLSGYVLALGFMGDGPKQSWLSYYGRRAVRLYLPVWGALALAALVTAVVHRTTISDASWWLNMHAEPITRSGVTDDIVLVRGTPVLPNPVLWSLKWEVLFSALLPLYLLVERGTRRVSAWVVGAGLLALMAIGAEQVNTWLVYLPVFGLGVLLASRRQSIRAFAAAPHRGRLGPPLLAIAILLLTSRWLVAGLLGPARAARAESIGPYVVAIGPALGATIVVALAMVWWPGRRVLEHRHVQWAGSRSFSLYLVHEPIVVSCALVTGGFNIVSALVGIVLALLAAEVFWRVVEQPSLVLARRVGHALARRDGSQPAAATAATER